MKEKSSIISLVSRLYLVDIKLQTQIHTRRKIIPSKDNIYQGDVIQASSLRSSALSCLSGTLKDKRELTRQTAWAQENNLGKEYFKNLG